MAFFRRTFSRRLLPDRFQEISERVYVFDCCLSTKELSEQDYKPYMDAAVANLQKYHPGVSFMVFNFKEGDEPSLLSDILSQHEMTVVDYPRHYEGYPILPLEMIHYCLRSSESWLSLEGQRNVILMHCERGGWPALAFMLAGLLLYSKKQTDEQKALEMVYKQAPKELLTQLSTINPRASQLRYLQYISRRSLTSDWPPSDAPLAIESLLLLNLPLFDGGKGCRPVVHIYGQDPSMRSNRSPRLLFSSLMSEQGTRYYDKEECLLVKINVDCRVQGDVFLECIHLGEDLVSEEKVFKVMFHTAFVQSYIMVLSSSEVDVLWNANSRIPNDFKAEVFFANPEEVQLSIAKEVKRVEESHESENEFFEAEEFDSSLSQAHNNDSLISREILEVESNDGKEHANYTIEHTHLDHHNEEKQENIDGTHLDHFNDNLMSREGLLAKRGDAKEILHANYTVDDTHLDHHSEDKQENIDDTRLDHNNDNLIGLEGLVIEINDGKETSHATYTVEENYLDHHNEDKQENIDASFVKSVVVVDDIRNPDPEPSVDDKAEDAPTFGGTVTQEWSSEQALEIDYELTGNPNDEGDSYRVTEVDFHPSVEDNYTLYENEANVANENISEANKSKVQDTSRSTFEVSCNEEEYDPKQADAEVDFETRDTKISSVHLDVVTRSLDDGSDTTSSQAICKTIVVTEVFTEDNSRSTSLEAKKEINDTSKDFLVEESLEDSSKVPSSEAWLGEGQDYSKVSPLEARSEPDIVSKSIVVEASEDELEVAPSESKLRLNNESKNFIIEEKQEDSSKAPSSEAWLGGGQDYSKAPPLEARSEPDIVSKSIVVKASEDEPNVAPSESKLRLNNESKNFLIEEKQEDSSKAPSSESHFGRVQDYSKASSLEAILEPVVVEASEDDLIVATLESKTVLNDESKSFLIEESQKDSSKAPFSEVQLGGSQDYSKASPLEVIFEPNVASKSIVAGGSEDKPQAAPLESKTRLNIESKNFLIEESQEDSSKAPHLEAIFEPKGIVEGSKDEPKVAPIEVGSDPIIVSKNIVVSEGSEDGPKPVSPEVTSETNVLLEGGQDIVETTSSETGLELKIAGKNSLLVNENREEGSRAGFESNIEAVEGSDQDSSEISSSEIEAESCLMSQSFISIEGSEDCSASETGSELSDQANSIIPVAQGTQEERSQAASSEAGSEPSNAATKHIVVMIDDNKAHEVKVQVQAKTADCGSKGVHQKPINKKKPRLADAVAKVTMQKRVISMWVPRGKQPTPDDMKQKAPMYKWIPKEPVSSTSEEA